MNQKELWNKKWAALDSKIKATSYAKRTYAFLKDKRVKTILDLGCGDGKDSIFFAQKGYAVTAIDFSREALAKLRSVIKNKNDLNIEVVLQDIACLDLEKKYDVIYANLSLHYFDDKTTVRIFKKLHMLLNKGGYLFVRCKSVQDSLYGKGQEIEKDVFFNKGKIQHLFSKEYLAEKLHKFKIVKLRRTSSKHVTMQKDVIESHFVEAVAQKS